ncbi:hypothetical protein BN1221_00245 [Brenneria goodwinii]|uniref:Uncharacterized protein n=1 Tax=Brenneria goodwinii TaxID=1109412 RepID=A0A0G4JQ34_9GAMM|nr:hypothetical protein BN1221_00245 [Brenneria goodwinii]
MAIEGTGETIFEDPRRSRQCGAIFQMSVKFPSLTATFVKARCGVGADVKSLR